MPREKNNTNVQVANKLSDFTVNLVFNVDPALNFINMLQNEEVYVHAWLLAAS